MNAVRYNFSGRLALLLAAVFWLGGCSLAPEYQRPGAGLPQGYAAARNAQRSDLETYAPENRDWWKNFNSSLLTDLQALALQNNRGFLGDRWALAQVFSQARAGRANLLPEISLGGSGSRKGSAGNGGYNVTDSVSGTAQASYELDLWGKNSDSALNKEFQAEAGMFSWRGAGLSLESEVALTYFSLLAARENLAVYDSMLDNARQVLDYQEKRERLGAAAPLDVASQRRSVQNMESDRINYLIAINGSRNNLCLLLGIAELPEDLAARLESERLMDILPPGVSAGLPAELLTRRPDVAEAEARLKAANANIGVARAAFLPGISLTASAGYASDSLSDWINPASALYSLAASLVQPIFNNGRLVAQYDEALAARQELVERYRQAALSAFWEVSTALEAGRLLQAQEGHRDEAAVQAAEAYRIARVRYASGAEEFISVLDAQDGMLAAGNSLVQTRLERLNSVVTLFKALGGGWAEEGNMEELRDELASLPGLTF
ncbi:MAG: efflux transporter outer membrane subunit [Deltaproteobacteria bacterium]|jgi:NodT family efflux transporter outer membrane factor (OMF) lipoprotein|nr:efflux transporter outer membrane subunit [Deltaproteobacteria bacterium]